LKKWLGAEETDVETIKATLEHLRARLENLKINPKPEHVAMLQEALKEVKDLSQVRTIFDRLRTQYLDIGPVLDAAKDVLNAFLRARPPQDEGEMLAWIINGAAALAVSNPGLKRALDDLVANAKIYATGSEKAIALARTNVESWFNDTMDRAGGWYKRNRQIGAFLIALIFAALINVDSIDIAVHLWREPALRQAVVAQAEQYKLPTGEDGAPDLQKGFSELQTSLRALRIPMGWTFVKVTPKKQYGKCKLLDVNPDEDAWGFQVNGQCLQWQAPQGWGLLSKLGGLIITAAAATLGAPYWFDILQKLISIRSAGNVPEPIAQGGEARS
jgi:hypothetical protein